MLLAGFDSEATATQQCDPLPSHGVNNYIDTKERLEILKEI
jgi:hypothetical protein